MRFLAILERRAHWTACFAVMFWTLNVFENGELSPHLTAPINSPYWAYGQSLPVNPKCRKGVFSILLVTGSVGHLRTVLTKMALISLSTARPIHPNAFMMRSAGVRQRDSGVVATVLLYAIIKFNVWLSRVYFFFFSYLFDVANVMV